MALSLPGAAQAAANVTINFTNTTAIPASNDFQSLLNGLGLTSYTTAGASLFLNGPASLTFEFLGSESGYDDTFSTAETIYVTLQNKGEEWSAVAVGHRPIAVQGGVVIKGTVNYVNEFTVDTKTSTELNVAYGIESFFVPQGMGREIENERQRGDLTADIAIDAQGRAAIKAMRRKGQVFYVEGIL